MLSKKYTNLELEIERKRELWSVGSGWMLAARTQLSCHYNIDMETMLDAFVDHRSEYFPHKKLSDAEHQCLTN